MISFLFPSPRRCVAEGFQEIAADVGKPGNATSAPPASSGFNRTAAIENCAPIKNNNNNVRLETLMVGLSSMGEKKTGT